jgi:hypothetical protein
MQAKILSAFKDTHPERATKEEIYKRVLDIHPETKITTFITELYNLMREGVIGRDDNGLYGIGVVRTKRLTDWLPVTQEPVD